MVTITGGTYFLNPISLDYPIIEWIETSKQFCDEIVLVDMGSTDNTRRVIRKHFGRSVKIVDEKWHFDKNYHEGMPRNKIVENATCDWVYLTDSDEILHEKDYSTVRDLAERSVGLTTFFRFPVTTFYGSCYLVCQRESRERAALFPRGKFTFGPPGGKANKSAHTLLIGGKTARKAVPNKKFDNVLLCDYGHCRKPEAVMRTHEFFVRQYCVRTGAPMTMTFDVESHIMKQPDLPHPHFYKWIKKHPKVMIFWVKKHWRMHGWEV